MQTITELKAKAYDILAQIQYLQEELVKVNNAIANHKPENEDVKKEEENG